MEYQMPEGFTRRLYDKIKDNDVLHDVISE